MNIVQQGPLAKIDRIEGFSTAPTASILVSFGTFLAALLIAVVVRRFFAPGGTRELVVISLPLLTLLLHVGVLYFVYRASDEYLRQRILKCAALAGVMLAFGTVANFCLEQLDRPHLSMLVVNLCGWSLFVVLMLWVRRRAR